MNIPTALAALPEPVLEALQAGDPNKLQAALQAMPESEARAVLDLLEKAGVIEQRTEPPQVDQEEKARIEAVLAQCPPQISQAIRAGNPDQLQAALDGLPVEEREDVIKLLEENGIIARKPEPEQQAAAKKADLEAAMAGLPAPVKQALQAGGQQDFQKALDDLPEAERQGVIKVLVEMGILQKQEPPTADQMMEDFDPLLSAIAGVALGRANEAERAEVERVLAKLLENGWRLKEAAERIWQGERNGEALTAGVDANSAMLIKGILAKLAQ